jgi:hypothetical protein
LEHLINNLKDDLKMNAKVESPVDSIGMKILRELQIGIGDLIPSHFQGFFPSQFQGLSSSH